jgi:hypothetical protein
MSEAVRRNSVSHPRRPPTLPNRLKCGFDEAKSRIFSKLFDQPRQPIISRRNIIIEDQKDRAASAFQAAQTRKI